MTAKYVVEYHQLFNAFGAPGIPNTYKATMRDLNNNIIKSQTFHFKRRAEAWCDKMCTRYGARWLP